MSNPGWRSLLAEEEEALEVCAKSKGYVVPNDLTEEETCQSYFNKFCELSHVKLHTQRHLQLYNKFFYSCIPITKISEVISKYASDLKEEDKGWPESLIWKTSHTALEIGRQHGAGPEVVIDLQVRFHEKVPKLVNLDSTLDRWSASQPIQAALKNIYQLFIKLYMKIIQAYTSETFGREQAISPNEKLQPILEEAETSFSNAEDTYNRNVELAERSEATASSRLRNTSSEPLMEFKLEFKPVNLIGKGSHGVVYSVEEQTTKELYACKDILATSLRSLSDAKQEILTLKKMRHTHIVTISAYSQTQNRFRILMEPLAEYDLKQFMIECAKQGFPLHKTNLILSWFGCLLHALKFAHSNRIKHKDIKLGNILVKLSHVYLSDFSLSKDFTEEESSVAVDEMPAGTLRYRAPETRGNVGGRRKADVFSLGCVYAEMLTVVCHKPFEELRKRCEDEYETDTFRDSLPAVVTWLDELKRDSKNEKKILIMWKTIRSMIHEELDMRHTADEALKSVEEIPESRCLHVH